MQDLFDYFETGCAAHNDLQHQITAGHRVFALTSVEQALGDFRAGAQHQGYIVRLVEYTYDVTQTTHEAVKTLQFGLLVAKYSNINAGGATAYLAALSDAERVMDDFINRMVADSRAGHPLFDSYFDNQQQINVQPLERTGDASYCGWMAIIRLPQYFNNCFNPDPARWSDGGLTPFTP